MIVLYFQDLSYGAEYVQVPCVNCIDHKLPDFVLYSTKREPTEGVNLNLDTEFLTGCDCTDDCQVCLTLRSDCDVLHFIMG